MCTRLSFLLPHGLGTRLRLAPAMSADGTVAEDVLGDVPEAKKASQVSDEHIVVIAECLINWRDLAPYLGLTEADEEAISEDYRGNFELQKREALRKWKRKRGRRATYSRLVRILCGIRHVDQAEKVKELLKSTECSSSPCKTSVATIQKHLKDCYTKLHHQISDLQLPFNLHIYVPITLKLSRTGGECSLVPSHPLPRREATLECSSTLLLHEAFQMVEPAAHIRNVVVIEGVAGSGKTTLMQHAAQQWAVGELLQGFELVILVPLQYPDIRSAKMLPDIIPHHSKQMKEKVADLISEQGGANTCFLFDTWDGMPVEHLEESFLYKFIVGTLGQSLPNCSIVVASRPEASVILHKCATTRLEVNRFSESQVNQFIHCSIGQKHGDKAAEELDKILKEKPEAASLCDLPINIVILTFLYSCFQLTLPDTRTELFNCFVLTLLRWHLQKRTAHKVDALREYRDLPRDVHAMFQLVCRLAYHGTVCQKTTFNEQDLKKLNLLSNTLKEANMLGLMQINYHLQWFGLEQSYSFLHHAVQDFLGAYHLSTLAKEKQVKKFLKILQQSPLSLVLPFYAGLTQLNEPKIVSMLTEVTQRPLDKLSMLQRLLVGQDDRRLLLALLSCIHESQRSEICLRVNPPTHLFAVGQLTVHLSLSHLRLDPSDCNCIGYFVANVCHKKDCHIDFNECKIGDHGVHLLLKQLIDKNPPPCTNYFTRKDYPRKILRCCEFYLSHNDLTHHGTRFIAKALSSTSVITALHLGGNWHSSTNIGNALKQLIEGLARNHSCMFLSLASTNLKPCHTHYLLLLITFSKSLDCFSLNCNRHLSNSISLLASALKYNNNLTGFCISCCVLEDQQLLALAKGLQHSKSMRRLEILSNLYSVNAAAILVRCLKSSSIITLRMDRDLIACHELQEALRLTNLQRSRRGSLHLTMEPGEVTFKDSYTAHMANIISDQVPEKLLRQK